MSEDLINRFRIEFHHAANGSAQGTKVLLEDGRELSQVTRIKLIAEIGRPLFCQLVLADQVQIAGGVIAVSYLQEGQVTTEVAGPMPHNPTYVSDP
jgi:hypothetical protein